MNRIRLLPVVVLAISALLVLKTMGLVTSGGYLLTGVGTARAAGGGGGSASGGTAEADHTTTPASEPTLQDTSPTLDDAAPTLGAKAAAGDGHGGGGGDHGEAAADGAVVEGAATPVAASTPGVYCVESDAVLTESGEAILLNEVAADGHGDKPSTGEAHDGEDKSAEAADEKAAAQATTVSSGTPSSFAATMIDCLPSGDAIPMEIGPDGKAVPLGTASDSPSSTQQQLLERLVGRRNELQQIEQDLALRASIVDAAEKRIEERAATLEALEAQIASLVDQRQEMETGQFASIVAMYEAMKPKDAANIFNSLDMNVLLQVAKTMSPRKMSPILAAMNATRAQELTVAMANLSAQPPTEMTSADLAALPQIVGQ